MERTQYDWQHDYLATPWEYPISANENHSTYDQFIQLRDTLIFTWKYYNDKASRKLCVWDKWDWTTTDTIEVWLPNMFRQQIEPDWATWWFTTGILWKYITDVPADIKAQDQRFWNLCCMVNKDWHYRIVHKEEILMQAWQKKAYCYVDIYRKNQQQAYEILYKWWVAVFDWEGQFEKTFSWSTSWTDPNGSCSVKISFKLWDIMQKLTAFGYQERDLKKWDILVLRMKDAEIDPSTWENPWNDLTLQQFSNFWSIEYLDLPYNI